MVALAETIKKSLYLSLIESRTINRAASLWFTSEEEQSRARLDKYSCNEVVLPLGLAREAYRELPPRGSFVGSRPELANKRLILFLGRVTPKKRGDLLIRSFAKVSSEFPDTVLVIAGPDEGGYGQTLRRLSESLGIAARVVFCGALAGRDVQAAFVDSDIFVLPSLQENFAISVVEAMACGVPVIVSKSVNIASKVASAGAGMAIDLDENSLEISLRNLLADPERAKSMGAQGRRLAVEKLTWETIIPSLIQLYEKTIAAKSGTAPRTENLAYPARIGES
jgi:glycosyltransferase involved in cell wall biosynthesis